MSLLQMMMAGLSLEYEGVITSGDLHIATKDGEAMFFHDSIDFSAYAGNDAGLTPYRFVFIDSAGKIAIAYGGSAGGGESFEEKIVNGTFDIDSNWSKGTGWSIFGGEAVCDGSQTSTSSLIQIGVFNVNSGVLYRVSFDINTVASGVISFGSGNLYTENKNTVGTHTVIGCVNTGAGNYNFTASSDFVGSIDNAKALAYTDVPATGLHLMSSKNGTTRNMASVEAGFNANAIVGVKIYG